MNKDGSIVELTIVDVYANICGSIHVKLQDCSIKNITLCHVVTLGELRNTNVFRKVVSSKSPARLAQERQAKVPLRFHPQMQAD